MTWVALRITSAAAPRHRVEQLVGREPELDVDLEAGGAHARRARCRRASRSTRTRWLTLTARRADSRPRKSAMRRDALAEVVVAEREREPGVAGRAERLAGHDRDLGLVEQHLAQLERGRRRRGRRARGRARPRRREAVERALRLEARDAGDRRRAARASSGRGASNASRISRPRRGRRATAASAARCATFATFDVECDCRLVAAAIDVAGPIIQPTRQPVIA